MGRYCLGISGASGVVLGLKALHTLASLGHEVHLVVTKYALHTANLEMGPSYSKVEAFLEGLDEEQKARIKIHKQVNFAACVASGSYPVDGTLILPCSMATLAAVAMGLGDNLIRRVADVAIKEGRPLILAPREMPFSALHLEHMHKLAQLGVKIVPPVPAWYLGMETLSEVEDQMVFRILSLLGVQVPGSKCWEGVSLAVN